MKEASLFAQALELPLAEREEFLREACGEDHATRAKVEVLLREHEHGHGLLDEPLDDFADTLLTFGGSGEHEPPSAGTSVAGDGTRIVYFGDYELQGEIARGAMGVVYRAHQSSLKRTVAVKMIRSSLLANDDDVARFRSEAEAAGSLDHPNIVPIYEVGEFQGQQYFSMKLIKGDTLREHLVDLRQEPRAAVRLMVTVAHATHSAHQRGILHRDLKPGNILIDEAGEPHVTDFGLAKQIESTSSATLSGQIMGTPSYMAPEQAEGGGKHLTTAVDVYGLGAVLYELLAGVPPHKGDSLMETLKSLSEAEPAPPSKYMPNVDRDLQTIAMKCLEKDPVRRYPSALEVAHDLEHWLQGEPITARPVGSMERVIKWTKRKPVHATAALLGVVLLLTLGIGGPLAALHQVRLKNQALDARNLAAERAESLRRQIYFSAMVMASEDASTPDGLPKINQWMPAPGDDQPDLRGWEWFYASAVGDKPRARYDTHRARPVIEWADEGKSLLLLDGVGSLSEWDFRTGRITRRWGDFEGVTSFHRTPGGDRITLRTDKAMIRRSLSNSEPEILVEIPFAESNGAWSPDGNRMSLLRAHDPAIKNNSLITIGAASVDFTEGLTAAMPGAASSPQAWSPDGTRLAIVNEPFGDLRVLDPETRAQIGLRPIMGRITNMQALAWSPAGEMIAVVSEDGEIRITHVAGLTPVEGWGKVVHQGMVEALAWSPDGTRLVTGGDDRIARVWEVATGQEVLSFRGHTDAIVDLSWSPDGRWIASGQRGGTVRVWNAREDSRPLVLQTSPPSSINSVSWNPRDDRIAIALNAGSAYSGMLLDLPSREFIPRPGALVKALDWHPGGNRLAVARLDGAKDFLQVIDLERHQTIWERGPGSWQVAWSPDAKLLAAMQYEDNLTLHSGEDGTVLRTIEPQSEGQRTERPTRQYRFSPDGNTLAWGQKSGVIALYDPHTGTLQHRLTGHAARVSGVDWTGDSAGIASASLDHTTRVWDVASKETVALMIGHSAAVLDVRWSPDDSRIATASLDGTVRLWDPASGSEVARFPSSEPIRCIDWSPDGTRLIAGGDAGIQLFDARPGFRAEALERFCHRVEEGEWDAAAAMAHDLLGRYASPNQPPWLHSGWWHRPATDAEAQPPSRDLPGTVSGWSWGGEFSSGGRIDLESLLGPSGDKGVWLGTRIFSEREQPVRLGICGSGRFGVWLESQIILEARKSVSKNQACISDVTLKEGWNTFSLRLSGWSKGDLLNFTLFLDES